MNRQEYNDCVGSKIKNEELEGIPHKLKFCISAKQCAKGLNIDEAKRICSLPKEAKEPKPRKTRRGKANCDQDMKEVTQCLVGKISLNTTADEIYQTLVRCHCKKNPNRIYASDINKAKEQTLASIAQLQNEHRTA